MKLYGYEIRQIISIVSSVINRRILYAQYWYLLYEAYWIYIRPTRQL